MESIGAHFERVTSEARYQLGGVPQNAIVSHRETVVLKGAGEPHHPDPARAGSRNLTVNHHPQTACREPFVELRPRGTRDMLRVLARRDPRVDPAIRDALGRDL